MIALLISLCLLCDTTQRPPEWWLHRRGNQFQLIVQHEPVTSNGQTRTCKNAQVFDITGEDAMKVLLHHWLDTEGQFMNFKAFSLIAQVHDGTWFPVKGDNIIVEPNEVPEEPQGPIDPNTVDPMFWVKKTDTGTEYHRLGCCHAANGTIIVISDAIGLYHLEACSVCKPMFWSAPTFLPPPLPPLPGDPNKTQ